MPAGSSRSSPSTCSETGSPAAVVRRAKDRVWRSEGCGASVASVSSRRSTPSRRRSSSSASRPAVSIAPKASRASSGRVKARRRAPVAWTVIALSAWATTSCNSPAIRARSSATARPAASSPRRSSSAVFSRSARLSAARPRSRRPTTIGAPRVTAIVKRPLDASSYGSVAASASAAHATKPTASRARPAYAPSQKAETNGVINGSSSSL